MNLAKRVVGGLLWGRDERKQQTSTRQTERVGGGVRAAGLIPPLRLG